MRRKHISLAARLLVLSLVLSLVPAAVFAHANYRSSEPPAGATLDMSPAAVRIRFTEAPDAGTTIAVVDETGADVTAGPAAADPQNAEVWQVPLKPLPPGRYTVRWQAVTADDNGKEKGEFAFTVAPAHHHPAQPPSQPPAQSPAPAQPPAPPAGGEHGAMHHGAGHSHGAAPGAMARPAGRLLEARAGAKQAWVGGKDVAMEAALHEHGGALHFPLRYLVEPLGGQVTWVADARVAVAVLAGHALVFTVGADVVLVDGKPVPLPVPTHIHGGRIIAPVQVLADVLGARISYDAAMGLLTLDRNQ